MPEPFSVVSFLSDYGTSDEFVGVCKGVMLGIAPHVTVARRHPRRARLRRAGRLRSRCRGRCSTCPAGVVLAIVDPGVGTTRRCVAIEVENGYLVGPDNGLLAPAVAMLGGPQRTVALTSEEHRLEAPSETFAGRDVMAPAAAYLADGTRDHRRSGAEIDPVTLVPGLLPLPTEARRRCAHRRGPVDRPLRQLPAQPRCRHAPRPRPRPGRRVRGADR